MPGTAPATVNPTTANPVNPTTVSTAWAAADAAGLLAAGLSPRDLRLALLHFVDLDAYLAAPDLTALGLSRPDPVAPAEWCAPTDAFVLVLGQPGYPAQLASRPAPPPVLVGRGNPAALDSGRNLAVVGSRRITALGQATTAAAIAGASQALATVVSGMAPGVDSLAHSLALANSLPTVGVVGSSLDALDERTALLADEILAAGGAVVSHLVTTTATSPQHLHARNHVIAQLCSVMVPCEGSVRSGTASAVRAALNAGTTLVVPLPRSAHQRRPGAQLLVELCDEFPRFDILGITGALRDRVKTRHPLADAVAHDPESLAALVEFSLRFHAA